MKPNMRSEVAYFKELYNRHPNMGGDRVRVCIKKKFVYLRVPKVASRSIVFGGLRPNVQMVNLANLKLPSLNGYFKWGFVRNPFDRLISIYEYSKQKKVIDKNLSLNDFTTDEYLQEHEWINFHSCPQHEVFYIDGKLIADFIGRYESLNKDWEIVREKIGCGRKLPVMNPTHKRKKYKEYFNKKLITKIEKIYEKDLELFDYEF